MKAAAVSLLASGAYGHGSMTIPRPRNAGDQAVHPSPGQDLSCKGDACYWYQVGCYIGCSECSGTGKSLYPKPYCSNPIEPTNNDPNTRSWDPHGQSNHGDFTKYNPWRAPGKAPVADPCGVASGYHNPSAYADIPKGYNAYDKGSTVLPEQKTPTYWKAGGTAEVGWAMSAQHGGGYSYRLCPKGQEITEACFQANHLSFTSKNTTVRYHDGSRKDFQIPTTQLVAEGQQWRRNPNPGCACDIGEGCKASSGNETLESGHSHVEGVIDRTLYSKHGPATPLCPLGTMFDAGWEPVSMGFLTGQASPFSIVDEVQVPSKKGEYVLGWRWDCEETDQVWNSCADIVITDDVPPTPAPTPAPPAPPSPAGKGDYMCYLGTCYDKPGSGKLDKQTCEKTCGKAPGPAPGPAGKGDYLCYSGKCFEKPGYGKLDKETCENTCGKAPGPAPGPAGKGDYLCYSGKCYEKPGYGKLDKETCENTCGKSSADVVV